MKFPLYSGNLPLMPDTFPFPYDDVAPWHYPKRQKICQQEFYYLDSAPSFYPLPELQHSASSQAVSGIVNVKNGRNLNERSVSPQSIAARERRTKITEKTRELSKLIPGGTRR